MDEIQHKRVSYLAETILGFVELKAAFFQKVYWTLELLFYKVKVSQIINGHQFDSEKYMHKYTTSNKYFPVGKSKHTTSL